MKTHKQKFIIHTYEVNETLRLSPVSFLKFLQETAGEHADKIGWGIESLMKRKLTWMLSRADIRIKSLPGLGEEVEVETWPSGTDRLFALRDFIVRDGHGNEIAAAVYGWLLIDLKSRRPIRPEALVNEVEIPDKKHPVDPWNFKLPDTEYGDAVFETQAGYNDIDVNKHVTSTSSFSWTMEGIPYSVREGKIPVEIQLQYLKECFYGDRLTAVEKSVDGCCLHALRRDNEYIVKARTVWDRSGNTV